MKATRTLLLAILLISMNVHAQKIYIRGGLGAAISTSANYISTYVNSGNSYSSTVKKQGFGSGIPFVIAAGWKFNQHYAIELGVDYFQGFAIKQTVENIHSSNSTYDYQWRGQMVSLVPAFVMSLPLNKFSPYARLGLKLGVLNRVIEENHQVISYIETSTERQTKSRDYGGIAIGAQVACGTDFVLSDVISLFCEIQLDGISYSPTHGKYIEYTENGIDKMNSRTVKQNEWIYKKEVTYPNDIKDSEPNEVSKTNYQFGNASLLLGVKINL